MRAVKGASKDMGARVLSGLNAGREGNGVLGALS